MEVIDIIGIEMRPSGFFCCIETSDKQRMWVDSRQLSNVAPLLQQLRSRLDTEIAKGSKPRVFLVGSSISFHLPPAFERGFSSLLTPATRMETVLLKSLLH